jgi:ribosomal protein L9
MAKDMSKGEKLDLILSELSALKGEVKKLAKQQDFLINQIKALQSRPSNAREAKQPAKKTSEAAQGKGKSKASKRPKTVEAAAQSNPQAS